MKNSHMDFNHGDYGLEVEGKNISISGTSANGNKNSGAYLDAYKLINILDSYFSYNQYGYGLNATAEGSITISGSEFNHNGWGFGGGSAVVLKEGDSVGPDGRYGAHLYSDRDITITDSIFNYNFNEGLYASAGSSKPAPSVQQVSMPGFGGFMPPPPPLPKIGNILLDGVKANNNGYPFQDAWFPGPGYAFGASLMTNGALVIMDSDFDGNRNYGVEGDVHGKIEVSDTSADENGGWSEGDFGALFKTKSGFQATGSDFSRNFGPGLQVYAKGDIVVDKVSANDNMEYWGNSGFGALFDTMFGGVKISNAFFNNNDGFGLFVYALQDVSIDNTTANNNAFSWYMMFGGHPVLAAESLMNIGGYPPLPPYNLEWANGDGAFIKSLFGSIDINDSMFNDNWSVGLVGNAGHNITLTNVEASGNGIDGAILRAGGDITVTCSKFSDNGIFGLDAMSYGWDKTITLDSNTFENNGWGDKFVWAHHIVETTNTSCGGTSSGGGPGGPGDGGLLNPGLLQGVIPVTGGEFKALSCTGISVVQLPTKEETIFNQPMCGYMASMELVTPDDLPGKLPVNWKYVDGFTVTLMFGNEVIVQLPTGASDTLVFPLSEDKVKEEFHILFWDASLNGGLGDWVDLGGVKEALKWVKTHNQTGTFLLVQ